MLAELLIRGGNRIHVAPEAQYLYCRATIKEQIDYYTVVSKTYVFNVIEPLRLRSCRMALHFLCALQSEARTTFHQATDRV